MAIFYILRPIGNFRGHSVHFVVIWYIFSRFGMLYQEKSGNPGSNVCIGVKKVWHQLKKQEFSLKSVRIQMQKMGRVSMESILQLVL
jgi:hypothetical protein